MNFTLAVFVAALAASPPTVSARQHASDSGIIAQPANFAFIKPLSSGPGAPGGSFADAQENAPAAQTAAPGNADAIRLRVKERQKVRITDDQGMEWQGRIETLAPDSLMLLTKDRQHRDVPYASIVRIDRPHDTVANGALIGLASGAILGLIAVLAEENTICNPQGCYERFSPGPPAIVAVPVFGGIGAGIGVAIDALVRRDPTLFRRGDSRVMLAPSLGHGVRGLRLSVQW